MRVHLKPLREQVMVITGASSGIGLTTARMAAHRGARLVVASRNEEALRRFCEEVNHIGNGHDRNPNEPPRAVYAVADVGQPEHVRHIADVALRTFGRFDTWVNNAGTSVYGKIEEVSVDDHRRLFDTNFWGVVYGSIVAAKHLRTHGGALINMGSVVSDRAIPLQGMYSATKHAVKGFTDALRMELEHEGAPVAVTLVKPTSIDTPFPEHAKNYMEHEPTLPPPVYAPEAVAKAVLFCAEHPRRDIVVGGGGKMISAANLTPRTTDLFMQRTMFDLQQKDEFRPPNRIDALYAPTTGGRERGDYEGHVARSSVYTQAALRPWLSGAVAVGLGLVAAVVLNRIVNDDA